LANELTKAYRSYLADLEREGRQTLVLLSVMIVVLAAIHPLLLLLALPSTALAWVCLYRMARLQFLSTLYGSEVLRRSLQFEDYDPDLVDTLELDRMEGEVRPRQSRLESFWRSYESSCRIQGHPAFAGYAHLGWMTLPLATLTIGLLALPLFRTAWNWLPLQPHSLDLFANGLLFIFGWLLGIGAATLGKYVIQVALVSAAWDAVINMAGDDRGGPEEAAGPREQIFRWRQPGDDKGQPAGPGKSLKA
jgi:hypothetical protein